ncbi:MAG: Na(+)/H(+) antiporter NhaG [Candidatus Thorarchaeota archaeon AB_25]|nr:MAG: Na(+)/H(+) antiporter NhaG [Candidatus Thorarchaeota archaeon AB_25]
MQGEELSTSILVIIAGILIVGVAIAKIAERYRVPHPIPLVITGLALGRVLLFLNPGSQLVQIAGFDFIAQITLAAVLFYAGLTLNLRELRLSIVNILLLATVGVLSTALIGGFTIGAMTLALGVPVGIAAFLIGAILAPTDPAALFSVLESGGVRVKRKLFSILEGEAVFNDATSVILVILVFEPIVIASLANTTGGTNWALILGEFLASMGLGVVLGYVVARIIGWAIIKSGDDTNVSILTATTPFLAYGLGELFTVFYIHPGALAAVFAGLFMANARRIGMKPLPQRSMRGVMKNVSFFFEIMIFILLGYSLSVPLIEGNPATETINFIIANPGIIGVGLLTAALVILVARPVSVFLVTARDRKMGHKERFFISWAGIKGVASAALAAIAVTVIINYSSNLGYIEEISIVVPTIYAIVFIVLLVSLIVQGLSTAFLANLLGLSEKQDRAKEITIHRDATRQALLHLVDLYTEGKIDPSIYSRLKAELEEEIFTLEDELRRVVSERRAQIQELVFREDLFRSKLEFYEKQFESEKISESIFQDLKSEIEAEIEEVRNRIITQEQRFSPEGDS